MERTSELAALKEAERPEKPTVSKDIVLSALVKADKKVTVLEDVLALVFDLVTEYDEGGRCGAADGMVYLLGIKDAYEAIHGPIIR